MSIDGDLVYEDDIFTKWYDKTLNRLHDSLLPAPDVYVIKKTGSVEKVDQKYEHRVKRSFNACL